MLLDETREWLDLRASHGAGEPTVQAAAERRGKPARRGRAAQESRCRWRTSRSPAATRMSRSPGAKGWSSLLSVPLLFGGKPSAP